MKTLAVLGSGIMGAGIAHVAALGGMNVITYDINESCLQKAEETIKKNMDKTCELGKVTRDKMNEALSRIQYTSDLQLIMSADMVIEAVPEKIELKMDLFSKLDSICPPNTVFASNTSALSITEMAAATKRSDRFIGMHFFNPAHRMKLVEVVRGLETSKETVETAFDICRIMEKEPIEVNEAPAFVASRINVLIGNEAFYMLESGIASAKDIDKALKLGLNHPMGPFELIDLVGLDTRLSVLEYLHKTLGEKFRPCPLHIKYVKAGRLGRKTGKGVYEY